MPSLVNSDELEETSIVNEAAFRRSFKIIFSEFPGMSCGKIYDALRSTSPQWDQMAAIADIRSQLKSSSEVSNGAAGAGLMEEASSTKRDMESLRGKRKTTGFSDNSDNDIEKSERRVALRPSLRANVSRYITSPDELIEDERLAVIDEDRDEEDTTELGGFNDESLPCRTLTEWTLFDEEHGQKLVGLEKIGEEGCDIRAVGVVRPVVLDMHQLHSSREQDEEDDEIDGCDDNGELSEDSGLKSPSKGHQILRLSAIFLWEVVMQGDGGFEIWLRTQYAFYHLLKPSEQILPFVEGILRRLSLSSIIISTLETSPDISTEDFLTQLQAKSLPAQTVVGILSSSQAPAEQAESTGSLWLTRFSFPVSYIKKEAQYLLGELSAYIDSGLDSGETIGMLEAPLLTYITKLAKNKQLSFGTDTRAPNRRAGGRNINDRVLLHENPTTVTEWIGRLAGGLFVRTLLVTDGGDAVRTSPGIEAAAGVDQELSSKRGGEAIKSLIDITCDPKVARREAWEGRGETHSVKWVGNAIWRNRTERRTGYIAADVDGDIIRVGDCVAIRPGDDNRGVARRKAGADNLADIWFARIAYLFEEDGEMLAHFRWFSHGGDTCLEETAGPRELFLLDSCDDNPLETVAGKIDVDFAGRKTSDDSGGLGVVELGRDSGKNKFFYRLWYDEEQGCFEDAAMHESHSDCDSASGTEHQFCVSCEAVRRKQGLSEPYAEGGDLYFGGQQYRVLDFVYILQGSPDEPYEIGQIQEFAMADLPEQREGVHKGKRADGVHVKLLKRYDGLYRGHYAQLQNGEPPSTRDNRRLYFTNKSVLVPVYRLEGKCIVKHIDDIDDLNAFKDLDDTFYVADKLSLRASNREEHLTSEVERLDHAEVSFSDATASEFNEAQERLDTFMSEGRKLRGMDIFAGAGGLSIGLDRAGAVKTEWAIEFSSAAALAFKSNLPSVKACFVYNQDANLLLNRAIKEEAGSRLEELIDFQGKKTPPMPKRGEVEFIYGGPPCQGFSGINRFKKTNDIKNSLIATYLSYVDFYRPEYFLLENVRGLLVHKLGGQQVGQNRQSGGIQMGTVKFILRALTSLGYQAKFSVLQAGEFGAPQSRRRVIFWGIRPGLKMPMFPQPTHTFQSKTSSTSINLPNGVKFSTKTRRGAPLPMTTVADAVLDLPPFEYVNPHIQYPATPEQATEETARRKRIVQFKVRSSDRWVGREEQSYAYPPLSEYQRMLRKGVSNDGVRCHFTRPWNDMVTERICSIPMVPGVDHRALPEKLRPWCLSDPKSAAARHNFWPGLFGRLDLQGAFQTALTEVHPNNKQGRVLHPTQHRVISVREHARSQGFPDSYIFASDSDRVKDMYRQVGNAVPIPMAYALGLELRKVFMERWFQEGRADAKSKGKAKA
ncbi:hypothetical protein FGG08_000711 [Glutinoglossum americanum]|uniref:DNA (cytosine-5)-methyltransferase n=1 Tax=Glutinoglossum americanum TaxID=1670608 RepID=A0A9P8IG53_9PEZI|nr:hypothetical protein FGG08_000711 [Glutinoglossum americanum]